MKKLTYSKNSWHYRLASQVGYSPDWDYGDDGERAERNLGDICSYWRHVVGGALIIAIIFAIIYMVATLSVHLIMGIVFSLLYGMWLGTVMAELGLFFTGVGITLWVVFKGIPMAYNAYRDYRYDHPKQKKPDGFIKEAYNSFKNKTCVQVKFTDE
jgi:hypothetical protein